MDALRLCLGQVMHRRLRPAIHAFRYPVFYVRIRLHELASVDRPLFRLNRFGLFAFHERDHGPRDGSPLLPWLHALLEKEGVSADGEVWLQTFPRVLGYVFNPVSFWYCHDRHGELRAVLAEVNNTFGEHHNYLLVPPDGGSLQDGQTLVAKKVFHVSPFMAVDGFYRFRFHEKRTGHNVVRIEHADAEGDLLHTAISGRDGEAGSVALLRTFFAYPWQSAGVILRIHWHALQLWLKRVPFFSKPHPPLEETTR